MLNISKKTTPQAKENTTPVLFKKKFKKSSHKYPTNFSNNNFLIPYFKLKTSQLHFFACADRSDQNRALSVC